MLRRPKEPCESQQHAVKADSTIACSDGQQHNGMLSNLLCAGPSGLTETTGEDEQHSDTVCAVMLLTFTAHIVSAELSGMTQPIGTMQRGDYSMGVNITPGQIQERSVKWRMAVKHNDSNANAVRDNAKDVCCEGEQSDSTMAGHVSSQCFLQR